MAGELKDYLSGATADYTATQFNVSPQEVMIETGEFRQKCVEFDDATAGVLTRSTTPLFLFRLQWPILREADAKTIIDFYFDTAKAKGKARTFEFPHPIDGETYVVRFWSDISRQFYPVNMGIAEVALKVEGYVSVASSSQSPSSSESPSISSSQSPSSSESPSVSPSSSESPSVSPSSSESPSVSPS